MRANDLNKCPCTKETQCQCESLHTINEAEETVKALVKFEHTEGDVQGTKNETRSQVSLQL